MATATTDFIPWYDLSQSQVQKQSHENLQIELQWLLEDTQNQLFSTVISGLKECQTALSSTTQSDDENSPVRSGPFKLVVSSGRLDIMKGILVRAGTALADFDIKVNLSAAAVPNDKINGPGVSGLVRGHSSLSSSFHHWGFGHSSQNHNHSTAYLNEKNVDKYSYNPGNSTTSPYSPFDISMKASARSLPLKQLVGAAKYISEALATVSELPQRQQGDGSNAQNQTAPSPKAMALELSKIYQLIQAAADSLKGPGQPHFIPKPLLIHGLASSNVSSLKSSRIDSPNHSGTSTPAQLSVETQAHGSGRSQTAGYSLSTATHLEIPASKFHNTPRSANSVSSKTDRISQACSEPEQELPESVTTEYATNPAFMEHEMPNSTIVSFYVSDGCIVTEVRVLEPLELPSATASGSGGHGASSAFRWFKGSGRSTATLSNLVTSNPEANDNVRHLERGQPNQSTLTTQTSDQVGHVEKTTEIETLIANSGPGFYPRLLEGRKIKDFMRVESQDPNLIMATSKLRALVCHVATLKKRIDILTERL